MLTTKVAVLAIKCSNMMPKILLRSMATSSFEIDTLPEHRALVIEKFGDPFECVSLKTSNPCSIFPSKLDPNQLLIEHIAAPINPADINVIQGVYGVKPQLPTALGNEGTGRVLSVGSNVKSFKEGDRVIFTASFSRTWQSHSIVSADQIVTVSKQLSPIIAAQLKVNPSTAYLLLKNYVNLKPNDVFIQNGANSACGVYIIQLAKAWGLKSINVIRDRPNKEELVKELKDYGADVVLTESELSNIEITRPVVKQLGKPKLVLNCVGGKNASDCSRLLADNGCVVTYGAMSKKRVELSAAHIFKNIKYLPHWTSLYLDEMRISRPEELKDLFDCISKMFLEGSLRSKCTTQIAMSEYKLAFEAMSKGAANTKHIIKMNE